MRLKPRIDTDFLNIIKERFFFVKQSVRIRVHQWQKNESATAWIAGRNLFVIATRFQLKDCRNDGIGKFLVFDFLYRTQVKLG